MTFESSVGYFYFDDIPRKIYLYHPRAKFILVVRHPVDRAISAWQMYLNFYKTQDTKKWNALENIYKNYFNYLSEKSQVEVNSFYSDKIRVGPIEYFRSAIENFLKFGMSYYEPGFIEKGLYYFQLKNYLKYFSLEQFIIIDSYNLHSNPVKILKEITDFLNGKAISWDKMNLEKKHVSKSKPLITKAGIDELNKFYSPYNEMFFELIKKDFKWN